MKKHFPAVLIFVLILFLGSVYLFSESMRTYPSYVHAWTQTDRLSIAMNFQSNGFDFFHPKTFNLLTKEGVTAIDFPIHDYVIAVTSTLLNTDLVTTFRTYNLLYTFIGLFFFFKSVLLISGSSKRAIWASLFLATLPFYVFYQNGFLASVPSFSNFLIAAFFLIKYYQNNKINHLAWSVVFFTLSALARSPFVIFLIALFFERLYSFIKSRNKQNIKPIGISVLGILLFLAYSFYNGWLRSEYGSMFLNKLLYLDSIQSVVDLFVAFKERWIFQFMSPYHWILFLLFLMLSLKSKRSQKQTEANQNLKSFRLISVVGVLLFFFALGKQFIDHDYYFIDSFLPLLAFALLWMMEKVELKPKAYAPIGLLCISFCFYFYSFAKQSQEIRYTPRWDDRTHLAYEAYLKSKNDLINWGITKTDTITVLDAVTTNMPFTVWGNQGYTVLNSGKKAVKEALDRESKYYALLDSNFRTDSWVDFPELIYHLDYFRGNELLSIYTKSSDTTQINFFPNLIYYGQSDFDQVNSLDSNATLWMQTKQIDSSHGLSYKVPSDYEFFLSTSFNDYQINPHQKLSALVWAEYFQETELSKAQLVLVQGNNYQARYLESQIVEIGKWQAHLYSFSIDANKLERNQELKLYYWNQNHKEFYIDNLKILIYQ